MTQREIDEIELSISFGQRLVEYYLATLKKLSSTMLDNEKIRQHFERDRAFIRDIIEDLEQGINISSLYIVKKRLTTVGQEFFKDEFKKLKTLLNV